MSSGGDTRIDIDVGTEGLRESIRDEIDAAIQHRLDSLQVTGRVDVGPADSGTAESAAMAALGATEDESPSDKSEDVGGDADEDVGVDDPTVEDIDEFDLTQLRGIGESVERDLNAAGIQTRNDLRIAIQEGDESIRSVPAMWRDDVAEQLGVELGDLPPAGEGGTETRPESNLVDFDELVLITTAGCPGCQQAKDMLDSWIPDVIEVLDVQESDRAIDLVSENELPVMAPMLLKVTGDDAEPVQFDEPNLPG